MSTARAPASVQIVQQECLAVPFSTKVLVCMFSPLPRWLKCVSAREKKLVSFHGSGARLLGSVTCVALRQQHPWWRKV